MKKTLILSLLLSGMFGGLVPFLAPVNALADGWTANGTPFIVEVSMGNCRELRTGIDSTYQKLAVRVSNLKETIKKQLFKEKGYYPDMIRFENIPITDRDHLPPDPAHGFFGEFYRNTNYIWVEHEDRRVLVYDPIDKQYKGVYVYDISIRWKLQVFVHHP